MTEMYKPGNGPDLPRYVAEQDGELVVSISAMPARLVSDVARLQFPHGPEDWQAVASMAASWISVKRQAEAASTEVGSLVYRDEWQVPMPEDWPGYLLVKSCDYHNRIGRFTP